MKKLVVILAVLVICASFAEVQAGSITLRPMIGYGFGTGRIVSGTDYVSGTSGTTQNENIYFSGGSGLKFGLGFDADLAENLAIGVDFGYSLGLKTETNKGTWTDGSGLEETKVSYFPISATIKAKAKLESITVFAGMGPTILVAPKATTTMSEVFGEDTFSGEAETTYKMGFGFHGLLGIEYEISESMVFIAQVRNDQVSVKTDKWELTEVTYNGTDWLSELSVRDKNVTFEEDDTADDSGNENVAEIRNAEVHPADSFTFGIGIGLKF